MHPLRQYLERHGLTAEEFAARIGVRSGNTVIRITAPEGKSYFRRPTWPLMRRIAEATAGEVTPNDFVFPNGMASRQPKKSRRGSTAAVPWEGSTGAR